MAITSNTAQPTGAVPREENFRHRQHQKLFSTLIKMIGAGLCLFFLLYVGGIFSLFNINFIHLRYNAIFLAGVLTLIFLLFPAGKKVSGDKLPWYDLFFIFAVLSANLYIIVKALDLVYYGKSEATTLEMILGFALIVSLMEAVRRTLGWTIVIIALAFVGYTKFGYLLPGDFSLYEYTWERLIAQIYLSQDGVYGGITYIAATMILAFITFGVFFNLAGGGKLFNDIAFALTGSFRGGPAKGAIVGSALFGTLSGSPVANVTVTGTFTIPLMKSVGYSPSFAGAVEAVASTGGAIMPPIMGAVAFIMADMLQVTYNEIALAATIPAVLFFLALFIQTDLRAAKEGLRGLPRKDLPSLTTTLINGGELLLPFVLLIVLLFVLRYPPEEAGVYTIAGLIVVSMLRKKHRISPGRLMDGLYGGLRASLEVSAVIAVAGIIVAMVTVTGVGVKLSSGLVTLAGNSLLLLVIISGVASYIMGMGVSLLVAYVLLATLVAPAMIKLGVLPMVAHFFIMYMGATTFFTPPYCPAAFVASPLAGASPFRIGLQAMRLGIVCFIVPVILVYNPALILVGSPETIILAAVSAVIGVISLSAGIEGYLFSGLSRVQQLLCLGAGTIMIFPGLYTDIAGAAAFGFVIAWQWRSIHRKKISNGTIENKEERK
ncbi:MAG: TRAP transporter permease [Desulfobacterales bacterium]|nr:TRAP transporter permease [Desulfobacterales bacterium]